MKRLLVGVGAVCLLVVIACGGSGDIGGKCTGDNDCSSLSTGSSVGYCAQAGVCTRACTEHQDCECPNGTSNGDVANGKCDNACVGGFCVKVCANDSQCNGSTTCASAEDGNGNSLGYSICG